MPDTLFIEIIEKMLADPQLKSKISDAKIDKIRKLLTSAKLPTRAELAVAFEDEV